MHYRVHFSFKLWTLHVLSIYGFYFNLFGKLKVPEKQMKIANVPPFSLEHTPSEVMANSACLHWAFLNSHLLGYVLPSLPQTGKYSRVHALLQSV